MADLKEMIITKDEFEAVPNAESAPAPAPAATEVKTFAETEPAKAEEVPAWAKSLLDKIDACVKMCEETKSMVEAKAKTEVKSDTDPVNPNPVIEEKKPEAPVVKVVTQKENGKWGIKDGETWVDGEFDTKDLAEVHLATLTNAAAKEPDIEVKPEGTESTKTYSATNSTDRYDQYFAKTYLNKQAVN